MLESLVIVITTRSNSNNSSRPIFDYILITLSSFINSISSFVSARAGTEGHPRGPIRSWRTATGYSHILVLGSTPPRAFIEVQPGEEED